MIIVENLVKMYGQVAALQGISFQVPTGQVLGFLGPNGAGKTTTMKILTGYLYATSGRAVVDGTDVRQNPLDVRRRVGYLPETNPLYTDMRVDDYLKFVAEIRGVRGTTLKSDLDRVIQVCGLAGVLKKGIIQLSKGFRQRVGLAQAMIHDPPILILDEPTSGLDPNQIIEIRELIRSLGANRTVILSTHYLQEVEAVCDRIIIVAGGKIVADGTREDLCATLPSGAVTTEIVGPVDTVEKTLQVAFPGSGVERVTAPGAAARFRVTLAKNESGDPRARISDVAATNGWQILELHREGATLESVFRALTAGSTDQLPPSQPAAPVAAVAASESGGASHE